MLNIHWTELTFRPLLIERLQQGASNPPKVQYLYLKV